MAVVFIIYSLIAYFLMGSLTTSIIVATFSMLLMMFRTRINSALLRPLNMRLWWFWLIVAVLLNIVMLLKAVENKNLIYGVFDGGGPTAEACADFMSGTYDGEDSRIYRVYRTCC